MPIIAQIGRKTARGRAAVLIIYALLILMSVTMVVPFLITLTSSSTNDFDYDRFSILPQSMWSRGDRFMKGLVGYFNLYADWHQQSAARFEGWPAHWRTWSEIGQDQEGIRSITAPYLNPDVKELARWRTLSADYAEFVRDHPLEDSLSGMTDVEGNAFLLEAYRARWHRQNPDAIGVSRQTLDRRALELLEETWGMPVNSIFELGYYTEQRAPYWQQSWTPPSDGKYRDVQSVKQAFRMGYGQPGVRRHWLQTLQESGISFRQTREVYPLNPDSPAGAWALWPGFIAEVAPASRAVPFAMRAVWRKYLGSEEVSDLLDLPAGHVFDVDDYNRIADTRYTSMFQAPFPVPADAPAALQDLWLRFLETRYPIRLMHLGVTPELESRYHEFLRSRFRDLETVNRLLQTSRSRWEDFPLHAELPPAEGGVGERDLWVDFVKFLPLQDRMPDSSEHAWQRFLLETYGSVTAVNETYGWDLGRIEEAFPPFDIAYAITFLENEHSFVLDSLASNYRAVGNFLRYRGRAIVVTFILVSLAILATLTINPMAAYGLSRFAVRGKDKIILYLVATMAFPAMVSAIPAYLLMRDLNLLNTFFALVLPFAANGMSIFILKGFFDSLPRELYDAATIDGAGEMQIFRRITMPMMKPILAIQSLYAFLWAYNSWEWALIICQKQSMWTLAVWLFQADTQWWASTPWISTAGYVVVSIPTLIVFLSCQKIILRGIIIPSMK